MCLSLFLFLFLFNDLHSFSPLTSYTPQLTYTLVKNEEDEPQYFLAYAHIEDGEKCDSDCTTTDSLPCWHNPQHEEPCRGGTSGSKGPSSLP